MAKKRIKKTLIGNVLHIIETKYRAAPKSVKKNRERKKSKQ